MKTDTQKRTKDMKTYEVTCTLVYNGTVQIVAASPAEALGKAQKMFDEDCGDPMPSQGQVGGVPFNWGECTADYAEELKRR